MMSTAFPPEFWEVLNWVRATVALQIVAYTGFVIASEFRVFRSEQHMTFMESFYNVRQFRLGIGTMVAFFGEFIIAFMAAITRYLQNVGYDMSAAGQVPIVLIPIAGGVILIAGAACIARSIVPRRWHGSRTPLWIIFVPIVLVVLASRVFR